jgi:hypothetical protein
MNNSGTYHFCLDALTNGQYDQVIKLKQQGFDINYRHDDGNTVFIMCVVNNLPQTVAWLIKNCPEINLNIKNWEGKTGRDYAVQQGNQTILSIIDKGEMVANGEIATNGLEEEKVDQIKEGEEARNWDLPPEILSLIFSFLDPESLAKAGLVSKYWRSIMIPLWKPFLFRHLRSRGMDEDLLQKIMNNIKENEDFHKLFIMSYNGVIDALTAEELKTKQLTSFMNMSHGPMYSNHYFKSIEDETAGNGRYLEMQRTVWWFSVRINKPIYHSGDYTLFLRMKIKNHGVISPLTFSLPDYPANWQATLTAAWQQLQIGQGWFYVVIRNFTFEQGFVAKLLFEETHTTHQYYCFDYAAILPSVLLKNEIFPPEKTFFLK